MQNVIWNSVDEYNDINTLDQYHIAREAGLSDEEALKACSKMSRDNARTPVQWSSEKNAGFTTGTPWLKVNSNYKEINVAAQEKDPNSVLNYYRKLVALRKSFEYKEVFTYGTFVPAYQDMHDIMAYYRVDETRRILVAANFGINTTDLILDYSVKEVLLSNKTDEKVLLQTDTISLNSCEVVVLELNK